MNLYSIGQRLKKQRCAIHNEAPKVVSNSIEIKLETCCEPFKNRLKLIIVSEKAKQEARNIRWFLGW